MIKAVHKTWGQELWYVNTELYCSKLLEVKEGHCCSLHYHINKDEVFYVLEGNITLELENDIICLAKGQSRRIFPGQVHRFTSNTKLSKILETSTHHEDSDSHRLEVGGKINGR